MKTIKDFKNILRNEKSTVTCDNKNTLLGMHLNTLFGLDKDVDATHNYFDEKVEVIAQMHHNGINVFTDKFKLGSVSKAFYQYKLKEYSEY